MSRTTYTVENTWTSTVNRGSQKDVVYFGWPIAPSYMSQNAGGGGGGFLNQSSAVHLEPK